MKNTPLDLINSFLCPLPVDPKTKKPFFVWKFLQSRFPTSEEIEKWNWPGTAIICGSISQNLEVIDFDEKYKKGIFEEWKALLPQENALHLCVISQTQNGGFHVLYRCDEIEGNQKLASDKTKKDDTTKKEIRETWIETRGEGGYVLEYPNPGYTFIQGDISSLPVITAQDRAIFLDTARALTQEEFTPAYIPPVSSYSGEVRPGDAFNEKALWKDILEPHGWTIVDQQGEKRFWRRPGKNTGISATENWNGHGLLFIFSTSTVFQIKKGYTKFHAYTLLNHNGDFREAAKALGQQTYGEKKSVCSEEEGIVIQRASDVVPKNINWLWPGKIAKGKLCLIAGNPGLGKSQAVLSLAAIVSNGGSFPAIDDMSEVGSVIILSAEDDAPDTMVPRLIAAGANLQKIYFFHSVRVKTQEGLRERGFSLIDDLQLLTKEIDKIGDVSMVVVDPLSAYMGFSDKKDTFRDSDVRALIMPIVQIMASRSVAFVGVVHFNKTVSADAIGRVMGSIAFIAAARTSYAVIKDNKQEGRRLFLPIKNNIASDSKGVAYRIQSWGILEGEEQIKTSRIEWEDEENMEDTNESLKDENKKSKEDDSKLLDAITWLKQKCTESPEGILRSDLIVTAQDQGISERTLERAKKEIDIISEKTGVKNERRWKLKKPNWNIE